MSGRKPSHAQRKRRNIANRVVIGDDGATVIVLSQKRRVRVIVKGFVGKDEADASINLDEAAVDKLIRRLQATRGGKAARKPKTPPVPDTPKLR